MRLAYIVFLCFYFSPAFFRLNFHVCRSIYGLGCRFGAGYAGFRLLFCFFLFSSVLFLCLFSFIFFFVVVATVEFFSVLFLSVLRSISQWCNK